MNKMRYWKWILLLLCSCSYWFSCAQAPSERIFEVERLLKQATQLKAGDSSLILASKALIISREEQYESGVIQAYDLKARLYKKLGNSTESLRHLIQLIPLLEINEDQESLYDTYIRIGDIYLKENLYEQALANFRKAQLLNPNDVELGNVLKVRMQEIYKQIKLYCSWILFTIITKQGITKLAKSTRLSDKLTII